MTFLFSTATSNLVHSGVRCTGCLGVVLSHLTMPAFPNSGAFATLRVVELLQSSGLVEFVQTGVVSNEFDAFLVDIVNTAGDVTVRDCSFAPFAV